MTRYVGMYLVSILNHNLPGRSKMRMLYAYYRKINFAVEKHLHYTAIFRQLAVVATLHV